MKGDLKRMYEKLHQETGVQNLWEAFHTLPREKTLEGIYFYLFCHIYYHRKKERKKEDRCHCEASDSGHFPPSILYDMADL
jgi:hypothetical protein